MVTIWFSPEGAGQTPPKPWRVQFFSDDDVRQYAGFVIEPGAAVVGDFRDTAFDLPDGPRAVIRVSDAGAVRCW